MGESESYGRRGIHRERAVFLRESSGSTNIEKTLLKALRVLKLFGISHLVCGGFAVQERGYPRFIADVDVIVPDVEFAIEKLPINGFKQNLGSNMTVTDREDVVKLVQVNQLPRDFAVDLMVRDEYHKIWDALHQKNA